MTSITALGVGSGLDLNGLLDQLQQGENQKLTPITNQKTSYQAKISAFGSLKSALASLQDAMHVLSDPSAFQAVKSTVSGTALTAAATNDTPPGDYQIHVTQRAQASSVATLGVTDSTTDLGGGTVDFTFADGTTKSVSIDAAASSLEDIRDAINAQNGGVRASLVNDGSAQPYRLVLQAADTGSAAAVSSVQFTGGLGSSLQLDTTTQQSGQDAMLTINGIAVQSANNVVEGAIQGVTLNITGSGDATLQVTRDGDAIKGDVHKFVDAYNGLVQILGGLAGYDASTQTAGILLGDSTVRSVQSQLRSALSGAVDNGGTFTVLSDVGVTLQLDGTLKVDDDKLGNAVTNNLGALTQFFAGGTQADGMADQIDTMVGDMTSSSGLIGNATDSLNQSIKQLDDQYDRTQQQIDATMAMYRQQFSQLDSMIAKMNSTSSYLTQQFDAMGKLTVGGK
ncbi:MAG TPA: flagellar filament capping protein FliD [Rhodanobacteraceae bacterium]